jgi:hypothetical protein
MDDSCKVNDDTCGPTCNDDVDACTTCDNACPTDAPAKTCKPTDAPEKACKPTDAPANTCKPTDAPAKACKSTKASANVCTNAPTNACNKATSAPATCNNNDKNNVTQTPTQNAKNLCPILSHKDCHATPDTVPTYKDSREVCTSCSFDDRTGKSMKCYFNCDMFSSCVNPTRRQCGNPGPTWLAQQSQSQRQNAILPLPTAAQGVGPGVFGNRIPRN